MQFIAEKTAGMETLTSRWRHWPLEDSRYCWIAWT
jgi:hypothetical protein